MSELSAIPQVKSPRAIELDKLVERMTEFYSQESNRDMYKLKKVTAIAVDCRRGVGRVTSIGIDEGVVFVRVILLN